MKVRLHSIEPCSLANGPGRRAVVWFQGCTLGCPGCFNPATHDPENGFEIETARVAGLLLAPAGEIEGVSFSGGEPFQQSGAFLDLLKRLDGSGLSRLCFSGFTLSEIRRQPLGRSLLACLDVLVAGRYLAARHHGASLLGSSNQRIHLLTNRYTMEEIRATPAGELIVHTDGSVTVTGIALGAAKPQPNSCRCIEGSSAG